MTTRLSTADHQVGLRFSSLDTNTVDCGFSKKSPQQPISVGRRRCVKPKTFVGFDVNGGYWHAIEKWCESWSCPACSRQKMRIFLDKCQRAKPNRFLTLTSLPCPGEGPRETYDAVRRQISELIKWLRKRFGPCEYCRVLETTKLGYPHFHLLVRSKYLPQAVISDEWYRLTGAFVVHINDIKGSKQVITYAAKYLRKQEAIGFTERRISYSRNFDPGTPKREKSDFCFALVENHRGPIEQVSTWVLPNGKWEQQTERHWIC